ncbi:MAG: Uma2 family endonuclease [Bernardetiaceae bacterium]|jgi:hypothetical protein|nr:Uma2 family endonuclease [Bernardetiaceae bacterium]
MAARIAFAVKTATSAAEPLAPEPEAHLPADATRVYECLVKIKGNLDILFADRPDVLVAGDLPWFASEGQPQIVQTPNVLVALGRPKGHRSSYRQWDEGQPPQVVFELLTPALRKNYQELFRKHNFYQQHGVQEYYLYDADEVKLSVFLRHGPQLILQDYPTSFWQSPALGITLEILPGGNDLLLFFPNGQPFLSFVELDARVRAEREARLEAERRAEAERQARAEQMARFEAEREAKEAAEHLAQQALAARHQAEQQAEVERLAKEAALAELAQLRLEHPPAEDLQQQMLHEQLARLEAERLVELERLAKEAALAELAQLKNPPPGT